LGWSGAILQHAAKFNCWVFKFQVSSLILGLLLTSPRSGLHKPTTNNRFVNH
jgi:hypothetical protein